MRILWNEAIRMDDGIELRADVIEFLKQKAGAMP